MKLTTVHKCQQGVGGLASFVDVPANPEKQESSRGGEGRGTRKKKRGRVSDVFRGATSDWNSVPHEPGGYKVNKKGPICPATKWQTT